MQVSGNGRVRRTEDEWRGLVNRWQTSGQSVREFCRDQKIQASSLQRWRGRLAVSPGTTEFVSVTPPAVAKVSTGSWSLELVLPNGCTLRFQG